MPADLHIHTNYSDGIYTPEEIVRKAKEAGLTTIAITDHDTVDGIERAIIEGEKLGIRVIPGIELTTDLKDTEIHILGYFIDYKAQWFLKLLKKMRDDRENRVKKIAKKLKDIGISIDADEILKQSDGRSVGRPHVARALLKKGIVSSIQEAFNKYLDSNSPAYVPHFKLSPAEAIQTIIKAEGVPVFAHPAVSACDEIIPELVKAGLAGIEIYYSKHSDFQIKHYLKIAEQYNLLVTGGSDFHGTMRVKEKIGGASVPDEHIDKLEAFKKNVAR
jgi:3',5'-nucleoside bisphosphate phosphatase